MKISIYGTLLLSVLLFVSLYSENASNGTYELQGDSTKVILPKDSYSFESQLISSILTRYHYNRTEINDSMSAKIFNKYIDALDYGKNYFLKSDVDKFSEYKYKLDDLLLRGDLKFYYDVFNIYLERLNERIAFVDSLLKTEFDYSIDEVFEINRDSADWAVDKTELNDLWRKRLKNDALTYKLNGKDWEFIQKTLRKRYDNYADFLNKYNSEDVFQLAMNAYSGVMDPHTNYLSPATSDNFKIDMSLSLEGIGARLQTEDDYTKVVEVIPGGPAFKSKLLQADDKIIAVAQGEDGEFEDVMGWRITDVVKLIRGPKGTIVRLMVLKAGSDLNAKPIEIKLIRDKVKLEDQAVKNNVLEIMNDQRPFRIGIIEIPKFYSDFQGQRDGDKDFKSTTKDVHLILDSLKSQNIDGIIIDLRNDGGGSLTEAIELTGLFIKDGPVVQVKGSDGKVEVGDDPDPGIVYSGPLAVLVNRFSASASEIFSAAIQDYGRGIVIGEQTYGKGTVQNLIDLNRLASRRNEKLGQVKLTIAKYYRVNGGSTQNLGVKPDIIFPSAIDPKEFGESSEPTALPWDQIAPAKFNSFSNLTQFIPDLIKKHNERIANDKDFKDLLEDIDTYKENREKKFISLNENVRRNEKEELENKKLSKDTATESVELESTEEQEIPGHKKEAKDFLLEESAYILSDLIMLTIG